MELTKVLVDTNVASYIFKNHSLAQNYIPHLTGKLCGLSFITIGEFYFWAEDSRWGTSKRKKLETTIKNFVVIPYDHEIAKCFGIIKSERKRSGKPISLNDAWIAACAMRHKIPLLTHNFKDFENISDLVVITENPDKKN